MNSSKEKQSKLKYVKLKDVLACFVFLFMLPAALIAKIFIRNFWLVGEEKNEARDNGYWFFKYVRETPCTGGAEYGMIWSYQGRGFHARVERENNIGVPSAGNNLQNGGTRNEEDEETGGPGSGHGDGLFSHVRDRRRLRRGGA